MKELYLIGAFLLMISFLNLFRDSHKAENSLEEFRLTGYAQGTSYHIIYYATEAVVSVEDVNLVLAGIDSSLSLYKPYSTICRFNSSSTGCVIDDHLSMVFKKSVEVTHQTEGLFDITVKPLVQAWGFGVSKEEQLPNSASIKALFECVGMSKVKLEKQKLIKTKPCVMIDMNGIAQGYSVDVLAGFLKSKNIQSFMVELGGEIRIEGRKPSGAFFQVGIESPEDEEYVGRPLQKIFALEHGAITTSGIYRKYKQAGDRRISHIINPKTGYPEVNELISVTVYAEDAMTADAYDNALMLMGLKNGVAFVESKENLGAYFIYEKEDGSVADFASSKFQKLLEEKR